MQHGGLPDHRLKLQSKRRHLVCYWAHGPWDDRFTYHADLIPEMQLLLIRRPAQ